MKENFRKTLAIQLPHSNTSLHGNLTVAQTIEEQKDSPDKNSIEESKIVFVG